MNDMTERKSLTLKTLVWTLGLAAFLGATTAYAQLPRCVNAKNSISPGRLELNLDLALRGQAAECDWEKDIELSFVNELGSGSFNIPVLAAAIALVKDPVNGSWNMYDWWDKYLRGELGRRTDIQWYYGGKELGSTVYQHFNVAAVMTVHHRAHEDGRFALRDLARDWLRATFAIHALSAAPQLPVSFHDPSPSGDQVEIVNSSYAGPWVGLVGMRSTHNSWKWVGRSILFARAVGLFTNAHGEAVAQAGVRTFLEANWRGTGATGRSVYGLNGVDRNHLNRVVGPALLSNHVRNMYSGIRTITPLHLVRWGGKRLNLIEKSHIISTAPTYGAYYDGGTKQAHMLYPWRQERSRKDITHGKATLNLAGRYAKADNFPLTSAYHGELTDRIDGLPAATPNYHVTIRP